MSQFPDVLKSGADSVAGVISDKLDIDPATAKGYIDKILLGDNSEAVLTDQEQQNLTAEPAQGEVLEQTQDALVDEATPALEGLLDQATAIFGGSQSIMDKAQSLVDRDGNGNPLNDITGMVGKFFGKGTQAP